MLHASVYPPQTCCQSDMMDDISQCAPHLKSMQTHFHSGILMTLYLIVPNTGSCKVPLQSLLCCLRGGFSSWLLHTWSAINRGPPALSSGTEQHRAAVNLRGANKTGSRQRSSKVLFSHSDLNTESWFQIAGIWCTGGQK